MTFVYVLLNLKITCYPDLVNVLSLTKVYLMHRIPYSEDKRTYSHRIIIDKSYRPFLTALTEELLIDSSKNSL